MGIALLVVLSVAGQGLPDVAANSCGCTSCQGEESWGAITGAVDSGCCDYITCSPRGMLHIARGFHCKSRCRSRCKERCPKRHVEGLDLCFNCGCSGSYNFPVPPLYTCHWPGMYKQPSHAAYVDPWVRPELRRARDVVPAGASSPLPLPTPIRIERTSMSQAMQSVFR